ncbi:hypothetical protein GmHk_03G007535 [Glycine max]|nr:hypothetical protein GmHk_03G007535 [Glycine max]
MRHITGVSRAGLAPDTHAGMTPVRHGVRCLCRHWTWLNNRTRVIGRGPPSRHTRHGPTSLSVSIAAKCRVRFLPCAEMSASSLSQAKEQDDDTKPLWTYVTKIKSVGGGGNYEIKCNICDFTFNGSYTRVRAHLLKMTGKGVRVCQKVTIAKLIDLKKIDNEVTLRVERSKTKFVSLPPISTQHQMDTNTLGVDPKRERHQL